MNDYTVRDKKNYGNTDITKVAYPKFQEKIQICRDLLHEYDYSAFFGGNELTAGRTITGAVNFLMDIKRGKEREIYSKECSPQTTLEASCIAKVSNETTLKTIANTLKAECESFVTNLPEAEPIPTVHCQGDTENGMTCDTTWNQ